MTALDHLVFAVPDVDSYVHTFAAATGVAPVFGGSHPGRGTKNYLLRLELGSGRPAAYLEFIGLDSGQPGVPADQTMFGLGSLGRFAPHFRTWAVSADDIDALAGELRQAGFAFADPVDASRTTPDGQLLRWRFAVNPELPYSGMQPFLIDWGDTPHPATAGNLPRLELLELRITHPDPELGRLLEMLGWGGHFSIAETPGLITEFSGPKGQFRLR
jgi:hypothetical protein